jgi:hypothetical protein
MSREAAVGSGLNMQLAAELTHEQPERETWIRLAEMWASAAARCRHEAGAISEGAAVYLSGAPAEGQSEHRLSQPESFRLSVRSRAERRGKRRPS